MLLIFSFVAALAVPSGMWSATTGFAVQIGAALGTFSDASPHGGSGLYIVGC